MTEAREDDRRRRGRGKSCTECGSPRAPDQRYCLACGERLGSLPHPVAALLEGLGAPQRHLAGSRAKADTKQPSDRRGWPYERSSFMPSPRAAAIAVIGMLALGVAIGSGTEQLAQGVGLSTILLESPSPQPVEEGAPPQTAAGPEVEETAPEPAPAPAPIPAEVPFYEAPLAEEPPPQAPEPPEEPPAGMPEVKHVFVVMLGENGFEETFGEDSKSPYLKDELPAEGELLPNYFAVANGELANEIAFLSGQGPTPETAADCPTYSDLVPAAESTDGQVEGNGCVYPYTTRTLPMQLTEKKLTWRAYVQGVEGGADAPQPETCRHPQVGEPDPHHVSSVEEPYVTWRNPFVYFHSLVDKPECAEADVGLAQLSSDLKLKPDEFPSLAYIAPDACHKGGEAPCDSSQPADPTAVESFLEPLVEEIKESLAYKDGGLIAITSAEARQGGEAPDASSCCIAPAYPNMPTTAEEEAPTGPVRKTGGGGQVGMVLVSPFVEPGTTSETYFNHFSLLATVEELFGLEKIGYAAEPAITGFDESIFNAAS